MHLGMMNNPKRPVITEVERIGRNGFSFVDLTMEGPQATQFDVPAVRRLLEQYGLGVIGHTDPNLPYAYPIAAVRKASLGELERCAAAFAGVGATLMNIHPCYQCPPTMKRDLPEMNQEALGPIVDMAHGYGLRLMLENFKAPFDSVTTFKKIFKAVPDLGFHLDVGHANLGGGGALNFCRVLGSKLAHVHLSDNRGREDDHMPIGAGHIDWESVIPALRATGYDDSITLEVFADTDAWAAEYLKISRAIVLSLWDAAGVRE